VVDTLARFREQPTLSNCHLLLMHARNCAANMESLMEQVKGKPPPKKGE
jgi:hypothetical protein